MTDSKIIKARLWDALPKMVGYGIGFFLFFYGRLLWNPASDLRIEAIQTTQAEKHLIITGIVVHNQATLDLKDPSLACDFTAPSGTVISSNIQVVYEVVPVGNSCHFGPILMGVIPAQTEDVHCYVKDVTVKWPLVGLAERLAINRR